ncbi:MAG TPA: energy transducer TonB [bacterium]
MNDHKKQYGIAIRLAMLASTIITIMLFLCVPYAEPEPYKLKKEIITMVEEYTAEINKYKAEPPPAERPKVAVVVAPGEAADKEVETIAATDFNEDLIRTAPSGPDIEVVSYYKVEVKPQPLNAPIPEYPDLARKAGIEGKAVVKMLIDIDGSVIDVQILKSSGNQMLDEAALTTARKSKFTPAKQRDKLVRVWVSKLFEFKLEMQ